MKTRVITAILTGTVFMLFIVLGGRPFVALTYLLATMGLFELLRMRGVSFVSIPGILSVLMLWIILFPSRYMHIFHDIGFEKLEVLFLLVMLMLISTIVTKNKFCFEDVSFLMLATFYVGMGFYYFIETRSLDQGLALIVFILFSIWAADSGGYFVGRKFGKRKLAPNISPKKTVEGFVGGIAFSVIVAIIFQLIHPLPFSFLFGIFVALIISIFGPVGDLVESALKRKYQVKDSGNILPGHGGILDRFDSMIFVLPLLHLLQLLG